MKYVNTFWDLQREKLLTVECNTHFRYLNVSNYAHLTHILVDIFHAGGK